MIIQAVNFELVGSIICLIRGGEKWPMVFIFHVYFFIVVRFGRKEALSYLLPVLFWSSRFTLTPQRFSTAVFTLNAHGDVSHRFSLTNLAALFQSERCEQNRLCHKYVQLYLHALCSWLVCLGQWRPAFYINAPFAQSRALSPLPRPSHSKL